MSFQRGMTMGRVGDGWVIHSYLGEWVLLVTYRTSFFTRLSTQKKKVSLHLNSQIFTDFYMNSSVILIILSTNNNLSF